MDDCKYSECIISGNFEGETVSQFFGGLYFGYVGHVLNIITHNYTKLM